MKCKVYGFIEIDSCYLVIENNEDASGMLRKVPGLPMKPVFNKDMTVSKKDIIVGLDVRKMLKDIETKGYHIQWPNGVPIKKGMKKSICPACHKKYYGNV